MSRTTNAPTPTTFPAPTSPADQSDGGVAARDRELSDEELASVSGAGGKPTGGGDVGKEH